MRNLKFITGLLFIIILHVECIYGQKSELQYSYERGLKNQYTDVDSAKFYFTIVDSLGHLAQDSQMIIESAIILSSYYNIKGNREESLNYINRALPYCDSTKDSIPFMNTLTSSIKVYDPKTTDSLFLKAIAMVQKVEQTGKINYITSIYNNYASLLHKKGDLGKAAIYYKLASENASQDYLKYQVYHSLLNIFDALNNENLIKEYLDKSIHLAEKNNYKNINGHTALHKAKYLIRTNNLEDAKKEIDKAEAHKAKLGTQNFELSKIIVLSRYYSSNKNWYSFQEYLDKKTSVFEELKIQDHPTVLMAKAKCAYYLNDLSSSEKIAKQVLEKSKSMNLKNLNISSHELLAKIYAQQNQYAKAIKYKDINKKLTNQYYDNLQAQNILFLEAEFNRKEQEIAINELNRSNIIKEENLERKNAYLKIGTVILSVISLLLLFLYRLYKKINIQKEIISKSLTEKDLLLREIHHRVKNNLQLVSSLLTMQGRSIDDAATIQAINEGKSRVRSMALIHQDLYNKDNLTAISVKQYVEKLATELFMTYDISDDKIKLSMDVDNIDLDVDTVVPLGLIINELITNSLKYAWPENDKGNLDISLKQTSDKIRLSIKDDGVGYDSAKVKNDSFGSTLVSALTLQLNGELSISNDNGTETKIEFQNS